MHPVLLQDSARHHSFEWKCCFHSKITQVLKKDHGELKGLPYQPLSFQYGSPQALSLSALHFVLNHSQNKYLLTTAKFQALW